MAVTQSLEKYQYFQHRIQPLLEIIYDESIVQSLLQQIFHLLPHSDSNFHSENLSKWSQDNVLLITYGNSIEQFGETPLVTLKNFLEKYLKDTITGVHILPFFPYSSDDGFSVIDYLQVNPLLGDWEDIENIANQFDLMADLVINHISSQSDWFQQFQQGEKPGCDYFITVDPSTDLSNVVRPRSTPVLTPVDTPTGEQYVWATFSEDQIDLNFANPNVLIEF
ncbi:MAG: alpha-amylase family glycosyl hydrolase, partial [Cyanobacteriota bacterium]|nr:alpha-amylase family glycosyl hydrolase [Cyanobacteriota bacterium]